MLGYTIVGVLFWGFLLASYSDLKTREVPDKLSYGLILSMIVLRVLYVVEYGSLAILYHSLIIGGLFFIMSLGFQYVDGWGGADVKLLTALGIGMGTGLIEIGTSWLYPIVTILVVGVLTTIYYLGYTKLTGERIAPMIPVFPASLFIVLISNEIYI